MFYHVANVKNTKLQFNCAYSYNNATSKLVSVWFILVIKIPNHTNITLISIEWNTGKKYVGNDKEQYVKLTNS